jgi:hypothetical protein
MEGLHFLLDPASSAHNQPAATAGTECLIRSQ